MPAYRSDDWREYRGSFTLAQSDTYKHTLINGSFRFVMGEHHAYCGRF